jgi:hypothetical protein
LRKMAKASSGPAAKGFGGGYGGGIGKGSGTVK